MSAGVWAVLAGAVCGVISGLGIGGGTLLMVWMTLLVGLEQRAAQGINLVYFLPTAAAAILLHGKHRYLDGKLIFPAALLGCLTAAAGAFVAGRMDLGLLRRLFGGFLLIVGVTELFKKTDPPQNGQGQ